MPEHLQSVLYTAPAVMEGGREGHGPSLDGRLVVDLSVPGLTVAPDPHTPFLTREQGAGLRARAHGRCPYSKATCGNIDVALPVDGVLLPSQRGGPVAGRGEPA
jgi:organic hydroperoxide reductase OsmC/OhrA